MDAALVALVKPPRGDVGDERQEGSLAGSLAEPGEVKALTAKERGVQHPEREVLAAVDRLRLGGERLLPHVAQLVELGRLEPVVEVGPGEVEREPVVPWHQHEVDRALRDREREPAEPHALAVGELALVAELSHGVLLGHLQRGAELVGAHVLAERGELVRGLGHFGDHRIAGEVGEQLLLGGERGGLPRDALEHPLARGADGAGALVALVGESLASRAEGLGDLVALRLDLGGELVELSESPRELLEPHQELSKLRVALLWRGARAHGRAHGLREDPELHGELGPPLAPIELLALRVEGRAHPVLHGERARELLKHARAHGGVVDVEPRDGLPEQEQLRVERVEASLVRGEAHAAIGLLDARAELLKPCEHGAPRLL